MTRRENSRSRRQPFREPVDRILVVCGEDRTEPDYLNGIRKHYRNPAIKIDKNKAGVSPLQLVEYAIGLRDRLSDSFDEVWCVVDVDDFDLTSAVALAAQSGIAMAVSNPCFELWLLLHFDECRAAMTGYQQLRRRLHKHIAGYDKTSCAAAFGKLLDGVPAAIERARTLAPLGEEHLHNPSTGVWALVGKFERPATDED